MQRNTNGRNFNPSVTLEEYALEHDLDQDELVKLVKCTGTLKKAYARYGVEYYNINDLRHWAEKNSLRIAANARV